MSERIEIRMTGKRSVSILEKDWPVVAAAEGHSDGGSDPAQRQQALCRGELDTYLLKVRAHEDGRSVVYGTLVAGWTESEDTHAGVLLPPGGGIEVAIVEVGEEAGLPARLVRECLADLPPDEL